MENKKKSFVNSNFDMVYSFDGIYSANKKDLEALYEDEINGQIDYIRELYKRNITEQRSLYKEDVEILKNAEAFYKEALCDKNLKKHWVLKIDEWGSKIYSKSIKKEFGVPSFVRKLDNDFDYDCIRKLVVQRAKSLNKTLNLKTQKENISETDREFTKKIDNLKKELREKKEFDDRLQTKFCLNGTRFEIEGEDLVSELFKDVSETLSKINIEENEIKSDLRFKVNAHRLGIEELDIFKTFYAESHYQVDLLREVWKISGVRLYSSASEYEIGLPVGWLMASGNFDILCLKKCIAYFCKYEMKSRASELKRLKNEIKALNRELSSLRAFKKKVLGILQRQRYN